MDTSINDQFVPYHAVHGSRERLLRQVLALPNHPPVVELYFLRFRASARYPTTFLGSWADQIGLLAEYYGQTQLSWRNIIFDGYVRHDPGFTFKDIVNPDFIHPTDRGHRFIVDAFVDAVRCEALALATDQPWGPRDEELLARPLPPPLMPAAGEPAQSICVAGKEAMAPWVRLNSSVDVHWEGGGRMYNMEGWYALEGPNARLDFEIDLADLPCDSMPSFRHVGVLYTRKEGKMTRGVLSCVSGCTCESQRLFSSGTGLRDKPYVHFTSAASA
ncbi:hypothetical protein H632_c454p2 [Helicosporidium sp. ATCC 50920]|nr:hypothetical protein H632_c454p2 [Helicosporidium sp. ATCC 50920]|eukprot:KDD75887.1 hypothetical protein H632_c454p2 [Helicosporidium sp. ATCC 50920]